MNEGQAISIVLNRNNIQHGDYEARVVPIYDTNRDVIGFSVTIWVASGRIEDDVYIQDEQ